MRTFSFLLGGSRTLWRRAALLGCTLGAVLALTGCGGGKLNSFTWEVDAVPTNLDPQTVSASADVIAVTHLYSGLYRLDEAGRQPECVESCEISPDGLSYTFTLKEGLAYNGYRDKSCDVALTAQDFVFGLRRVFLPETASPYARPLGNILNGTAVAEGRASPEELGISAPDERTLILRLEQPDDNFLEKLCLPGAMPCNQAYFEGTKGTYGLDSSSTLGNGPFYLYNWTASGLFLRRQGAGAQINSLRLVLSGEAEKAASSSAASGSGEGPASVSQTAQEKVEGGRASAALSESGSGGTLTEIPYTATTWVLLYNCGQEGLSSTPVRQGLTASAAQASLSLPGSAAPAQGLVPPGVEVNGESYRQSAGSLVFESDDPLSLYKAGLAEAGLTKLSGISVLVPEGLPAQLFSAINQQWQKQLSAFFSVKELPLDQVLAAVESGDYQIALIPLSPSENDPLSLLGQFCGGALNGWSDPAFDAVCREEAADYRIEGRAGRIAALEEQLIIGCPLTPLFYETRYLLVDPDVSGLAFQPFGPVIDVSGASKK